MWENHLRNVHFSVSHLVIVVGTEWTTQDVVRIVAEEYPVNFMLAAIYVGISQRIFVLSTI